MSTTTASESNQLPQIVEKIRSEMEKMGVSPTELARRTGHGRAYIHRVLTGRQRPTLAWCERSLKALGLVVTVDFLPVE